MSFLINNSGAPKIVMDPHGQLVKARVGEPFRVKIPFKGSPVPDSTWLNVSKNLTPNKHTLLGHIAKILILCLYYK